MQYVSHLQEIAACSSLHAQPSIGTTAWSLGYLKKLSGCYTACPCCKSLQGHCGISSSQVIKFTSPSTPSSQLGTEIEYGQRGVGDGEEGEAVVQRQGQHPLLRGVCQGGYECGLGIPDHCPQCAQERDGRGDVSPPFHQPQCHAEARKSGKLGFESHSKTAADHVYCCCTFVVCSSIFASTAPVLLESAQLPRQELRKQKVLAAEPASRYGEDTMPQ